MLDFRRPVIGDRPLIDRYLYACGEGSCQHSFTAMFCTQGKYGDMFCEKDGFLYILREGRCTERERVYLFPMGDSGDDDAMRRALCEVLDDAHAHGARVRFDTVTQRAAQRIASLMPGRFAAQEVRDYAEYLYTYDRLANLPGREMASKRYDLRTLERDYGDRLRVEVLRPEHIDGVREFQRDWMENRVSDDSSVQLEFENSCIRIGLDHYQALGLSGIVVFCDGRICGYAYGCALSPDCYDVIIEKGDRAIPDIYRLLNRDLVRMCLSPGTWVNREEDLGVEGLRRAKLSYKPDALLAKYVLKEAAPVE